jgi:putative transcriptional regulator
VDDRRSPIPARLGAKKNEDVKVKHQMPLPQGDRPLDALIGQYAAGTLPRPLHALIAAHVDLNPTSARFATSLESLRAAEIEGAAPVQVVSRDAMLQAIFAAAPAPAPAPTVMPDDVLPPSLRAYLGVDVADVPWRTVLPGVKEWTVADSDGVEAKLYWIKAGRAMPQHTHEGQEVTLLLRGGFSDVSGHYRRGDVAVADHDLDHKPVADADEDCICFAVTDAPLKLTGPVARFFRGMFKH